MKHQVRPKPTNLRISSKPSNLRSTKVRSNTPSIWHVFCWTQELRNPIQNFYLPFSIFETRIMGFEIHEGKLKNISELGFNHSIHRVKSTKSSQQIIHDEGFQSYSIDPLMRSSLARKNSFKFSYSSPAMKQRIFNLTNSALRMSRSKCDHVDRTDRIVSLTHANKLKIMS